MKKLIIQILVIALAGFSFISCSNDDIQVDAYGNFETTEYNLAAETNGKIISMNVDEGDLVYAGDIIAVVDTMQLHFQKEELMARIEAIAPRKLSVQNQINALIQRKQNIIREKNRLERLYVKDAATEKQLDDIRGELQVVESEIAAKTEALQSSNEAISNEIKPLQVNISKVMDLMNKSIIHTPIDGRVLETYTELSEFTMPGKLVAKVADTEKMILRAYVSGAQLDDIKIGDTVTIRYDKGANEYSSKPGKVTWIATESEFTPKLIRTKEDRVNLVYAVKIEVDNKEGNIKTGMPGEVITGGD